MNCKNCGDVPHQGTCTLLKGTDGIVGIIRCNCSNFEPDKLLPGVKVCVECNALIWRPSPGSKEWIDDDGRSWCYFGGDSPSHTPKPDSKGAPK